MKKQFMQMTADQANSCVADILRSVGKEGGEPFNYIVMQHMDELVCNILLCMKNRKSK